MNDAVKILIVDDQARNLDALEAMLESSGWGVVRAQTADAALLRLLQNEFAAIVLDIRMPDMNGIELARLIKQRKRTEHVPILFLTAHLSDEADVLKGYGAGAVDYLSKPINADILRSKVGVFVDVFRKTRALAVLNETLQAEVGERQRAEEALFRVNQELEVRVQERTAALTRTLESARENEERLRMAVEVAQVAAWEWNLATGHMTWSADPENLFGFPPGAFGADRRIFRVLHPDDRAAVDEAIQRALETGTYEAEYRVVRPDQELVWITERGRVVSGPTGMPEKIVGLSRDVSASRLAEAERERLLVAARAARDEAERQSRLKDDFLATLSHELRTPLNMILGWTDILQSGQAIRDLPSTLQIIQRNARLQAKLIDDLLDMNRLQSGNVQLEIAPVDVSAALQHAMQGLQPAADGKGVRIETAVDVPCGTVAADPRRLQQVLWNLVHNAIKFTPSGGLVQVGVMGRDSGLQIRVQDDGQGISHAFLPHVFERFRQEDSSSTRESSGLGIGLSIAKHLVELHGGTLSAFSDGPGRGSTFVVEIPLNRATRVRGKRSVASA
jgi:PAS domain S-box-containing protein